MPLLLVTPKASSDQRVTDKSNTFSSGFSIPVMTRILDFTYKLTQKITEAVEFIVVSQHFSNTDHDEDDSQSSNSQTSVTPSMRDRHFTRYLYLLLKLNCLFTAFSLSRNQYTFVHCFRFAGAEIVVLWDTFDSHIPNDFTDVLMITQSALKEKGIYGRFKFRAYASDPANYPGFPGFWINEDSRFRLAKL
ncbi:hypothetical protein DY000_02041961 [Brassica cretica]|uniref:Uncharacterized protein n=1 Tax=Brassica cretica TaxID=69181 RepID=A0ABQ7BA34_BRACR|nr:hypothetical protein DY000_02041961 [Brassica cretica]